MTVKIINIYIYIYITVKIINIYITVKIIIKNIIKNLIKKIYNSQNNILKYFCYILNMLRLNVLSTVYTLLTVYVKYLNNR